jgi:plastocyanin
MGVEGVRSRRMALAAVVGAAVVAAFGAVPAQAANVNVTFTNYSYSPASVRIAPGDTVTWNGTGTSPANTFSGMGGHPLQWPSGPHPTYTNATATTRTETFATAGQFAYQCSLHFAAPLNMKGSVTVSANKPPTAGFTASAATAGKPVTFTSTSTDPNPGQTLSYQWDLDGDGAYDAGATGATATRTYPRAGAVTVRLRVTDSNPTSDGVGPESADAAQTITVAAATQAVAGTSQRATLGLVTTSLRRAGTRVAVRVRSSVAGTATVKLRRRGRTLALGTKRFTAPGTQTVRLKLTRRGRATIRRGRRVSATLALSVRDSARRTTRLSRRVSVRG